MYGVFLWASVVRLSHKRLMATFQVEAERGEQDLYRCVTQSTRGSAVSNFGELIVRGRGGSLATPPNTHQTTSPYVEYSERVQLPCYPAVTL